MTDTLSSTAQSGRMSRVHVLTSFLDELRQV